MAAGVGKVIAGLAKNKAVQEVATTVATTVAITGATNALSGKDDKLPGGTTKK